MNYQLFWGLFLLAFLTACGNKNEDSNTVSQRYIHKYGFEVSQNEWLERKGDGQIITAFKDGSCQTCSYKNGVLHGATSLTYPKAQIIKEKTDYEEGTLLRKTLYSINGLPSQEEIYENENTTITVWNNKGVPLSIEEYRAEKLISGQYFTALNVLESSIVNGKGLRVKRNPEGKLFSKEQFEKGELSFRTTFHSSGEVETISHFTDYCLHGEQKTFSTSGTLIRKAHWKNGQLHGKEMCYRNGKKYLEVPYANGKKEGVEKEYYKKQLVREVPWKAGQKHGMERLCYRDYTDIQWYFNGKTVGLAKFRQLREREVMIAEIEKAKNLLDARKSIR